MLVEHIGRQHIELPVFQGERRDILRQCFVEAENVEVRMPLDVRRVSGFRVPGSVRSYAELYMLVVCFIPGLEVRSGFDFDSLSGRTG